MAGSDDATKDRIPSGSGRWKLWSILIPCSYIAILVVLSIPALYWAMEASFSGSDWLYEILQGFSEHEAGVLTASPWFIGWLVATTVAQVALFLPVGRPGGRPRGRRRLWCAVGAAAFLAGLLTGGLVLALFAGIWGDDLPFLDRGNPVLRLLPDPVVAVLILFTPILFGWGMWWFILLKATGRGPQDRFPEKSCRWLLAGSALELIVAIPCHVITRQREDCCAPLGTFAGIASGVSVALLCCGPALYFLIRDRVRRKQPRPDPN